MVRVVKPGDKDYPQWICRQCAIANGGYTHEGQVSTFHLGICPVCKIPKAITEPRDFRRPTIKIWGKGGPLAGWTSESGNEGDDDNCHKEADNNA